MAECSATTIARPRKRSVVFSDTTGFDRTNIGEAQVRVLDETPLAKGIRYALNQRAALERFLEDARLPAHNNGSENALRREAVGRKNCLFVGHDDAGEVNAAFVSLLASCQLHGIEPCCYLRDLFCLIPSWPNSRVLELAPAHWRQTVHRPEVQQRLEANIYRRASLAPVAAALAAADAAR